MSKEKEIKTNAMRILDGMGIEYSHLTYECDEFTDGVSVADELSLPHDEVFKTLVTQSNDRQYHVFVIPVAEELDLKAAARCAGVRSVALIPVKEINAVTGYIRGGCTCIGMKKPYPVIIDETAQLYDKIYVSGGRRGSQIRIAPGDLAMASGAKFFDIVKKE